MKYDHLPNPFEDMSIPVLAAEPTIRPAYGQRDVGRTVDSNPATGAKRKRGRPRNGEKK